MPPVVPRCSSVTYWLTNGSPSSAAPRQLTNNAVVCARGLYNIEARPTCPPPAMVNLPVEIQLLNGNRRPVRTDTDSVAPFLLWDSSDLATSRTLPNGAYYIASSIKGGDTIRILQSCPSPRRPRRRSQCSPKVMMLPVMKRCPSSRMGM
jgi:hypothetical protein